MATYLPDSYTAFLKIKGVGKEKLNRYGDPFIGAILEFIEGHPDVAPIGAPKPSKPIAYARPRREPVEMGVPATPRPAAMADKKAIAKTQVAALYRDGLSPEAIAEQTLRSLATVEGYLLEMGESGEIDLSSAVPLRVRQLIEQTADEVGGDRLRPIKEALPDDITYFQIKVVLHERSMAF
jgi:ATP-dependent DNA helicase RecQ